MEEKKQAPETTTPPEKKKGSGNIILIILLVILLIAVGFLTVQNMQNSRELEKYEHLSENLEQEKENVTGLLEEMLVQYDTLSTENDQLQAEIDGQKEQIKELMKQVEKNKDNEWLVYKYRKEAETLREIMKGYVVTIDSLNTLNQTLTAEKLELEEQLGTVTHAAPLDGLICRHMRR